MLIASYRQLTYTITTKNIFTEKQTGDYKSWYVSNFQSRSNYFMQFICLIFLQTFPRWYHSCFDVYGFFPRGFCQTNWCWIKKLSQIGWQTKQLVLIINLQSNGIDIFKLIWLTGPSFQTKCSNCNYSNFKPHINDDCSNLNRSSPHG